ncbi:MAG: EAL domain-containing protein, partial [Ectothiorhodospiraceae bacterium]|nr:EAL domain-containing protein [Ectothiorhodospiraceae bacterium]
ALLSKQAHRVVFEITERASLDDVPDASSRVAALRKLGFRIAIDDLGAGYAGLASFAQLEPDVVKYDMSLIRDVHQSPTKQKVLESMTRLFAELDLLVISEGVETPEERDTLTALGCDLLQGYQFARPGPAFPPVAW